MDTNDLVSDRPFVSRTVIVIIVVAAITGLTVLALKTYMVPRRYLINASAVRMADRDHPVRATISIRDSRQRTFRTVLPLRPGERTAGRTSAGTGASRMQIDITAGADHSGSAVWYTATVQRGDAVVARDSGRLRVGAVIAERALESAW